jgi:NAD(P)H-flavin reductase
MLHSADVTAPVVDPVLPVLHPVTGVSRETRDTFTLELAPRPGQREVDPFLPGQFNMLYAFGAGEAPISISGDEANRAALVHTIRVVGNVTGALRSLRAGDVVGVRGPYGTPWPLDAAANGDVLVIAGGIGLAPLRSAIYHLLAHRANYGRVVVLYGTRTPEDLLYRRELERWRGRLDVDVHVSVDRAPRGWHGNVGVVTTYIRKAQFDPERTTALVCGPEVMMRMAALELERAGVGAARIFLSLERNMKCGIGLCGHCQLGPVFVCAEGPVLPYERVRRLLATREV